MLYWWRRLQQVIIISIWLIIFGALAIAIGYELRTSRVQAELFSKYASNMHYTLEPGRNTDLAYPTAGPYDIRLGYVGLPSFLDTLENNGYRVVRQPRWNAALTEFVNLGGYAIYNEKTSAGLTIFDRTGQLLHSMVYPTRSFLNFADIPPLVTQTLLFIENRELLDPNTPYRNPAIEWDRFLLAALGQVIEKINPSINIGGGSTLATQIEKFRHSPEGRTGNATEKLRQMLTASVRAYRQGANTYDERKRVVLDYLNSTPLTARPGIGEVNGLGDGLYAWFGTELPEVRTALTQPASSTAAYRRQAEIYKQVLALILAQRRPTFFLLQDRAALNELTNQHLRLLAANNIINPALAELASKLPLTFKQEDPKLPVPSFIQQKAANAVRTNLLRLLNVKSFYELDRLDATAQSTLDIEAQQRVAGVLQELATIEGIEKYGLMGERLFKPENDFSQVIYSFVLYERTPFGNAVRVQVDNLDKPLDLNEGAKLDLGSTAKLRTLATYLEIIGDLHDRLQGFEASALAELANDAPDNLTRFVAETLQAQPNITLEALLAAAMQRRYSANPGETFFTGGGAHNFNNFEKSDNTKIVDLHEAMRNSINLPFVRLMRDIVNYQMGQGPITRREIFGDPDHPARQAYLMRFADREGRVFLTRFYNAYRPLTADEALKRLVDRSRKTLTAAATIFRSVRPRAPYAEFVSFMQQRHAELAALRNRAATPLDAADLAALYKNYGMDKYNLADRGFIAGLNPLELWLVSYLQTNPKATREQMLSAGVEERQQTYAWLFRTVYKGAQDTRIRILLEQDAFARIHDHWAKLGYPFERLVPSLATSIGSSADRPGALADLMGIIVNDGRKLPTVRVEQIEFAKGTPYEALVELDRDRASQGEQVMRPETARLLRTTLADVVQNGTARRVYGTLKDENGNIITIGGKTGTGDHRFEVYAPGGRVISSRAVARTATLVFYIGEQYYGTITAHVEGEQADDYRFTSGLVSQILKAILQGGKLVNQHS